MWHHFTPSVQLSIWYIAKSTSKMSAPPTHALHSVTSVVNWTSTYFLTCLSQPFTILIGWMPTWFAEIYNDITLFCHIIGWHKSRVCIKLAVITYKTRFAWIRFRLQTATTQPVASGPVGVLNNWSICQKSHVARILWESLPLQDGKVSRPNPNSVTLLPLMWSNRWIWYQHRTFQRPWLWELQITFGGFGKYWQIHLSDFLWGWCDYRSGCSDHDLQFLATHEISNGSITKFRRPSISWTRHLNNSNPNQNSKVSFCGLKISVNG